jgi:hypothetical protein
LEVEPLQSMGEGSEVELKLTVNKDGEGISKEIASNFGFNHFQSVVWAVPIRALTLSHASSDDL